jgi:hypothetical protein
MKLITTAAVVLTLTGCASVAPFGDGAYVAKVASDIQNPQLVADSYCNKQGKVAYIENATATRAVFTCRSVSAAR